MPSFPFGCFPAPGCLFVLEGSAVRFLLFGIAAAAGIFATWVALFVWVFSRDLGLDP